MAQLWRLQHSTSPDPVFGYYAVSKPLSAILQASALCVVLVGTARYFKQQSLMTKGKIQAGGWEILVIMIGVGLVSRMTWGMLIGRRLADNALLRHSLCSRSSSCKSVLRSGKT